MSKEEILKKEINRILLYFVLRTPSPINGICIDVHDTREGSNPPSWHSFKLKVSEVAL